MSLVLSGGCRAVLYEALDDSSDDMYLDWFQGQLFPPMRVPAPGLWALLQTTVLSRIRPLISVVSSHYTDSKGWRFFAGLCLKKKVIKVPWWSKLKGSSYGL